MRLNKIRTIADSMVNIRIEETNSEYTASIVSEGKNIRNSSAKYER